MGAIGDYLSGKSKKVPHGASLGTARARPAQSRRAITRTVSKKNRRIRARDQRVERRKTQRRREFADRTKRFEQNRKAFLASKFKGKMGNRPGSLGARRSYDLFGQFGDVDKVNYESYVRDIWPKIAKYYGQSPKSKPPRVAIKELGESILASGKRSELAGRVVTDKPRGKRTVEIDTNTTMGAALRPSEKSVRRSSRSARAFSDYNRAVMIHELAHVWQGKKTLRGSDKLVEGGANALTHDIMRSRGMLRSRNSYDKAGFTRKARRRKGFVRHGQFR